MITKPGACKFSFVEARAVHCDPIFFDLPTLSMCDPCVYGNGFLLSIYLTNHVCKSFYIALSGFSILLLYIRCHLFLKIDMKAI